MRAARQGREKLETGLALAGLRVVSPDDAGVISPPAVVVAPPTLAFEGLAAEPTTLTYSVFAVVASGERALDALYDHLQNVVDALEALPDVVVTAATPGSYPIGGSDLPAYSITTEVAP